MNLRQKKMGSMPNNNILDAEVVVPLKYLNNFLEFLDLPMINCEIELELKWTKKMCHIRDIKNI